MANKHHPDLVIDQLIRRVEKLEKEIQELAYRQTNPLVISLGDGGANSSIGETTTTEKKKGGRPKKVVSNEDNQV